MLSELIVADSDPCGLAGRWGIHPALAEGLVQLVRDFTAAVAASGVRGFVGSLSIISGYREPEGITAPTGGVLNVVGVDLSQAPRSRHTYCPAVAADLRVGDTPASLTPKETWALLGSLWKARRPGARWGGDFTPEDLNHFDDPALLPPGTP